MEAIFAILGSVFSGGVTGIFGVFVQKIFDYKKQQQDIQLVQINNEHARLLAQMDIEKARRAAEATERVAEQQAQAQEWTSTMDAQARADEAAARDYAASLAADHATYLDPKIQAASPFARTMMTVVDSVRGLIRPVLTLYLVVLATGMFWWAKDLADKQGVGLKPDDLTRIISTIISTLLYLSTTTVVWWFGVRGAAKDKS